MDLSQGKGTTRNAPLPIGFFKKLIGKLKDVVGRIVLFKDYIRKIIYFYLIMFLDFY